MQKVQGIKQNCHQYMVGHDQFVIEYLTGESNQSYKSTSNTIMAQEFYPEDLQQHDNLKNSSGSKEGHILHL